MPYARYRPSPRLAWLVSDLWVQEDLRDAAVHPFPPTRVLPTGSVDVAFYYCEPFLEMGDSGARPLPYAVVTGPQSTHKSYAATGRTGIVIARCRPGRAGALFGLPLCELRDTNVNLEDLLTGSCVGEVTEQVRGAHDPAARARIVDAFLVSQVRPPQATGRLREALARIARSGGTCPVRELARATGDSLRQLQRRFRDAVGMGPKALSRLVRLQVALHLRGQGWSWGMTAHAAGYQDQSHLTNECRSLSGLTPVEVFRRRRTTALGAYYNATAGSWPVRQTMYV